MAEETKKIICPRCGNEHVVTLATSPVEGVWEVYQCEHCLYTWRSTEPDRRTKREAYPDNFKITDADMEAAPMVPSIPPLVR